MKMDSSYLVQRVERPIVVAILEVTSGFVAMFLGFQRVASGLLWLFPATHDLG